MFCLIQHKKFRYTGHEARKGRRTAHWHYIRYALRPCFVKNARFYVCKLIKKYVSFRKISILEYNPSVDTRSKAVLQSTLIHVWVCICASIYISWYIYKFTVFLLLCCSVACVFYVVSPAWFKHLFLRFSLCLVLVTLHLPFVNTYVCK